MDWSYKECTVTITTSKTGSRFRSIVKVRRFGGLRSGARIVKGDTWLRVESSVLRLTSGRFRSFMVQSVAE